MSTTKNRTRPGAEMPAWAASSEDGTTRDGRPYRVLRSEPVTFDVGDGTTAAVYVQQTEYAGGVRGLASVVLEHAGDRDNAFRIPDVQAVRELAELLNGAAPLQARLTE